MPGPKGEQCRKCYYGEDSNADDEPDTEYWCRRFPPVSPYRQMPDEPAVDRYDAWELPCVFASAWCGEFKPRDES